MKLVFSFLLGFAQLASASILRIEIATQALYLHASDLDPRIAIHSVPYVTFHSDPEWRFAAISAPFLPPQSGNRPAEDVNVASLYHIVVDGTYKPNSKDILVHIDASKAIQPELYPFTIEQVIDAVVTCVKVTYPPRPADEGLLDIVITRRPGSARKAK